MDLRLQRRPFSLGGKEYSLCCNMNVFTDVQEAYDGDMDTALNMDGRATLTFLAAMLNDCNEDAGDPRRFTARDVGRLLPPGRLVEAKGLVLDLVNAGLMAEEPEQAPEPPEQMEQPPKNAEATPGD